MEKKQKQKKSNRLFNVFLVILIICAVIGGYFYINGLVKPNVSVNGKTLTVNMTVQELVDAGFAVDDSLTGNGDMNLDNQPEIPGESYSSSFYYLYAPDQNGHYEYANVIFQVFNKSVNSVDFRNSQIYSYRYDPSFKLSDVSVLINDIDFANVNKEDAILAMEELGIKFDKDKKEEFMNGESIIIIGKSGEYSYIIETDMDGQVVNNIQVSRKV